MKVTIALTDHRPPVGTVAVEGGRPIEFSGWLGLINLLGGVVDAAAGEDVEGHVANRSSRDTSPGTTSREQL